MYLETLSHVNTVILDKTGTLTFGNPEVAEIRTVAGVREIEVIEAAAIAERPSEHPIGKAILKEAARRRLPVPEPEHFEYSPGKGVLSSSARGLIVVGSRSLLIQKGVPANQFAQLGENAGTVLVARNGRLLGSIRTEEQLRPEAVMAVRELGRMKLQVELLTGDSFGPANEVGKSSAWIALSPSYSRIRSWNASRLSSGREM